MPEPQHERFPKQARIKRQRDFDRAFRSGHVVADGVLVIHGTRNSSQRTRMGISISRRVGNAVARNYWKRIIREAFRKHQQRLAVGLDLVIRPKKGASPDPHAVHAAIPELVRRLVRRLPRDPISPAPISPDRK